ncbi:sulfatase [Roseibacillus persicicus]|uniref:Iduronate-2-sulfatase n=1 Tax=Roseibacillus persicicus TaxID=454148 RepID=A0A918WR71_9BACT|nr:sulfatase [Roseibacillus persicicus]GHC66746.1 iduronate-2-sulfatase [Roseibacillus persicicus]
MKQNLSLFSSVSRALIATFLCCPLLLAESDGKKNVLIFFIDDLRPELGCYGVDKIQSPAIDALASEGVLFERAYCQQALCAPSRISMMTGQYPDHNGIDGLFTPLRRHDKEAMTLPRYFQKQGYFTASYGKVYHHQIDDKEHWSDLPDISREKFANPETLARIAERVVEAKKSGKTVDEVRAAGKGPAIEVVEGPDELYRDGKVAKAAIESLRKNKEKPFFMCVGFAKPHLPFAAPKRYWDLYEREQFMVPERILPEGAPSLGVTKWNELRGYRGIPAEGPLSDELTLELRHGYAASVSFADAQVGKVMAELDRLGLREETLVILWGDHGYKLGEYGLWCKHTNFEVDTRVPLIVSAPGGKQGKRSHALVEIVDLFPTVVEMTGGTVPAGRDGMSLAPVLEDPKRKFRPFAFMQYPRGSQMGYALRNERWRYIEWIKFDTQEVVARALYDHQETQFPDKNLAADSEYSELVAELSKQLDAARRVKESRLNPANK